MERPTSGEYRLSDDNDIELRPRGQRPHAETQAGNKRSASCGSYFWYGIDCLMFLAFLGVVSAYAYFSYKFSWPDVRETLAWANNHRNVSLNGTTPLSIITDISSGSNGTVNGTLSYVGNKIQADLLKQFGPSWDTWVLLFLAVLAPFSIALCYTSSFFFCACCCMNPGRYLFHGTFWAFFLVVGCAIGLAHTMQLQALAWSMLAVISSTVICAYLVGVYKANALAVGHATFKLSQSGFSVSDRASKVGQVITYIILAVVTFMFSCWHAFSLISLYHQKGPGADPKCTTNEGSCTPPDPKTFWAYLALYIVAGYWVAEFTKAAVRLCTAYQYKVWYMGTSKQGPWWTVIKAIVQSPGPLATGSLILPFFEVFNWLTEPLASSLSFKRREQDALWHLIGSCCGSSGGGNDGFFWFSMDMPDGGDEGAVFVLLGLLIVYAIMLILWPLLMIMLVVVLYIRTITKFVTRFAYNHYPHKPTSFVEATMNARRLLERTNLKSIAYLSTTRYTVIVGSLAIAMATTLVTFAFLSQYHVSLRGHHWITFFISLAIGVYGYYVCSVLTTPAMAAIDQLIVLIAEAPEEVKADSRLLSFRMRRLLDANAWTDPEEYLYEHLQISLMRRSRPLEWDVLFNMVNSMQHHDRNSNLSQLSEKRNDNKREIFNKMTARPANTSSLKPVLLTSSSKVSSFSEEYATSMINPPERERVEHNGCRGCVLSCWAGCLGRHRSKEQLVSSTVANFRAAVLDAAPPYAELDPYPHVMEGSPPPYGLVVAEGDRSRPGLSHKKKLKPFQNLLIAYRYGVDRRTKRDFTDQETPPVRIPMGDDEKDEKYI